MSNRTEVTIIAGLLALAAPAAAQPAEAPALPLRQWSVTISPVHLIVGPIVEVTVERRIGGLVSVAVMAGGGQFTNKSSTGVENTFAVFEAGASVRAYPLGDFEQGLQVGASAEYAHLSGDDVNDSGLSAVGSGLLLSPFLGYKHVWSPGFTFDGQLGPSFLAVRAEGEDGSTAEDSGEIGVYLNLNVGWSF